MRHNLVVIASLYFCHLGGFDRELTRVCRYGGCRYADLCLGPNTGFGRYGLDYDCDGIGIVYDAARIVAVLWRPGAIQECFISADAMFRHSLRGLNPMVCLRVQPGVY